MINHAPFTKTENRLQRLPRALNKGALAMTTTGKDGGKLPKNQREEKNLAGDYLADAGIGVTAWMDFSLSWPSGATAVMAK